MTKTTDPILAARIEAATGEIARRYNLDPATLVWLHGSDGNSTCSFRSNRLPINYLARVDGQGGKNKLYIHEHTRTIRLGD